MRLLLDTHTLIWHSEGHARLSAKVKRMLGDGANQLFISTASLWEIAIKLSLGKLELSVPLYELPNIYTKAGASLLLITPEHAMAVEKLPRHHRDPFDRMLIAQARHEDLTLVTDDEMIQQYQVAWIW